MNNRDKLITAFEIRRDERVIQQNRASGVYVSPTYIDGGLTKLEDLAMRLYVERITQLSSPGVSVEMVSDCTIAANFAIEAANVFFDEFEAIKGDST